MNPETIEKIKEVMLPVAEKIGQGAQFGWEVVLRQQYVTAWLGVFTAILGAVSIFVVYKLIKKSNYWEKDVWPIFLIVFGGAGGVAAIIIGSITAITHFLNPAYYALQFFMGLVQ